MKQFKVFLCVSIFISSLSLFSQAKDIPVETLPPEVKAVLEKYVDILRNSGSLDNAAVKFKEIAGGSLVNEDGIPAGKTGSANGKTKYSILPNPTPITTSTNSPATQKKKVSKSLCTTKHRRQCPVTNGK